MKHHPRGLLRGLFASALIALSTLTVSPALAELTGTISGKVVDDTGQPLPGVSVTVSGPFLQGMRTAVTKGDGTYLVPNVPPGDKYKSVFALSGFTTAEKQGFAISVGNDTQVNATLRLTAVGAEVVVTGETPVVDITRTNTQASFDADYLRKATVGSTGRDYLNVLQHSPGVVGTGNTSAMGSNSQQNSFTIDGINTTDPVTHTFTYNLNFDSIQEVSVQTSSFEAQFGRATGAIVNVVTKSGGNEFSGSADGRYSSNKFSETGDFFDPKVTSTKNMDVSATLGGPVWKDRIWFFGNYQKPITEVQPTTTNAAILAANPNVPVRKFDGDNYGVKLSFTLSPSVTGFFNYQNSTATITGQENSVLTRPEASQTVDQGGALYKGKLNAVAGQNLMLEVSAGRVGNFLTAQPASGDLSVSRWTDRLTNVRYDSSPTYDDTDRPRTLFGGSATYFLSGALGNHQFKAGGDYDKTAGDRLVFNTGAPSDPSFCPAGLRCGATFTFNGFDAQGNRIPFQQNVTESQGVTARSGKSLSGYIQDQWRPNTQLTLNLGLRYDNSIQENTAGVEVIDFKKVQPRLSAAYDILGDGKNVVRASYGWFYDEPGLTLVRLLQTGTVAPIGRTYRWSTTQQRWNLINSTGGGANGFNLVDPDIKPTYEEQINVAFERELFRNTRASFTYVYKKAHDIYEDSALDDNGDVFIITNRPGGLDVLKYDYSGFILEASHRFARGLVNASYVYSKSQGSIDSSAGQYGGVDFDHNPENFKNRYGYLPADARHQIKIFAAYQIPFVEAQLGVNYRFRTGLPYNITSTDPIWGAVFEEPRGSSRTESLHVLDFNLEKQFRIGPIGLSIIGSVFNALDKEAALTYGGTIESPATLKQPLTFQRPRNYQIGARVEF